MIRSFILFSITASLFSGTAHAAKTFVYCSEGSPSSLNPQVATDGSTFNATRTLYNKLVDFKPGTTELIPSLALKHEVSKDGKTYTFHLRKDVNFHKTAYFTPTRKLNADDVLFSFNRQRLKDHPFHASSKSGYEYFDSMDMAKLIKDVVKVDEHTVKFILNNPEAPFLSNLAMDFASIISAEYGDQLLKKGTPEKIDFEPVGTGAFVFVRYDKDQMIRYKSNPDYFGGKHPLDNLVFAITPDASVRFQKLKTGECHLVAEPAPADLEKMKSDPNIAVQQQPGLNVAYLAMNIEKAPFNNALVRQAVHHALNRKSYIDAIYLGNAVVAKNPIPPTIWSYNQKVQDLEYNPEKAKSLLKEAGMPNGFETELWTMPVSRPYNPNGKKMGEMMQADLAKVGIKVKLVTFDWPTYLAKSRQGEHVMVQFGWTGDNGDPDNFLNVLLSCSAIEAGSNYARWCHKPFEEKIQKARTVSTKNERSKLYQLAQEVFKKEAPWVTLAHSVTHRAMSKKVAGYKIDPFGRDCFDHVDLN